MLVTGSTLVSPTATRSGGAVGSSGRKDLAKVPWSGDLRTVPGIRGSPNVLGSPEVNWSQEDVQLFLAVLWS